MNSLLRISTLLAAGLATATLTSCEPKLDAVPTPATGSVDVSRYVAIGDDYTAGVANGGLTREHQEYSFPNLLARQLQLAGAGGFNQPLLASGESTGGVAVQAINSRNQALLMSTPVTALDSEPFNVGTSCATVRYRFPAWADAATGVLPRNLGIPGLRLVDVETPGLGDEANLRNTATEYNSYLERVLPDNADTRSYATLVKQTQPSFMTVSIGLSDVLTFVRTGGTCGPLPSAAVLGTKAGQFIDSLVATTGTAKGVVLGVPSLASLPLTRTRVNEVNRQLGRASTAPVFVRNASGVVVAAAGDVVLLPMVGRIGRLENATGVAADSAFGLTRANPLRDEDVLAEREFSDVNGRITGRNGINDQLKLRAAASGGRLVYLDITSLFLDLAAGQYIDGVLYSGDPVTGGVFTLDGYTLSPRGNGLLVNRIIEALNSSKVIEGFGTRLPQLDINSLPATLLP